jgi:hypothetical protein
MWEPTGTAEPISQAVLPERCAFLERIARLGRSRRLSLPGASLPAKPGGSVDSFASHIPQWHHGRVGVFCCVRLSLAIGYFRRSDGRLGCITRLTSLRHAFRAGSERSRWTAGTRFTADRSQIDCDLHSKRSTSAERLLLLYRVLGAAMSCRLTRPGLSLSRARRQRESERRCHVRECTTCANGSWAGRSAAPISRVT